MASNRNNPYAKRRQKVKKPADPKANPFKTELKDDRNKKLVLIVVGIIIVVMVGTLILPYMSGEGNKNYKLPNSVLVADENTEGITYSAQSILLGETFNRVDKEYFVLFGTSENVNELASKITREAYYFVDSSKVQNISLTKNVSSGKKLPQNPNEIKIKKDVALIKIKNGKAIKFINSKADVTAYINKLNK
ncbi:hypothetical protein OKW22_000472 [Bacilli bacterium PM5-3]|nr:hypothetical protein [Bacilli bacterium PM5-3]MDH6603744.1 hypothetical protein [Bacilli bacterium PM5-9]